MERHFYLFRLTLKLSLNELNIKLCFLQTFIFETSISTFAGEAQWLNNSYFQIIFSLINFLISIRLHFSSDKHYIYNAMFHV